MTSPTQDPVREIPCRRPPDIRGAHVLLPVEKPMNRIHRRFHVDRVRLQPFRLRRHHDSITLSFALALEPLLGDLSRVIVIGYFSLTQSSVPSPLQVEGQRAAV